MKPLKKAEQRNVRLDKGFYTIKQIRQLIESGVVKVMDWKTFSQISLNNLDFMYDDDKSLDDYDLLIFLADVKEIKVKYNVEFGFYQNVVTTVKNEDIAIIL